jgi:hypothetical protein
MSLINDALKRAKQANHETPAAPPPVPHFRPVEPGPPAVRYGVGMLLPISLGAVALLALMLLWVLSNRDGSVTRTEPNAQREVAARTLPSPDAARSATEAATAPSSIAGQTPNHSANAKSVGGATPAPTVAAPDSTSPTPSVAPDALSTNLAPSASESADTNNVLTTALVPPTPAPLKLQGIVYNPKRPSALINGRVVFVGDRIQDLRILAIHSDAVLLAGAGRTNVLSLDP